MSYKIIELLFEFDAFEPLLDKETVDVHYNKHHKSYEEKLNKVIEGKGLENKYPTLELLMKNYQEIEDQTLRTSIREFGGGLINHNFLWNSLKKNSELKEGSLKEEIIKTWGSIEEFKKEFLAASLTLFGSGWVWLVKRKNSGLKIIKTFNQDNPWFLGFTPLIGIDLWEHAYYLKHKGNRTTYFENMWQLIDWDFASEQFTK